MEKYTYYRSIDGENFDYEYECIGHEKELLNACQNRNEILFFDPDLIEMNNNDIVCSLEDAPVIYIKTEEAYTIARSLADYYGFSLPSGIGFWSCEGYGNWEDLEEILKEDKELIDHKIKVLEEVKNGNYKS